MAAIQAALAAEEEPAPAAVPQTRPATQASTPAAAPPAAEAGRAQAPAAEGDEPPAIYHEHAEGLTKEQVDAMLEESHEYRNKRKARQKVLVNLTIAGLFLGLIGGAYGWYAVSPNNQAIVHGLMGDVKAFTSGESKESLSDIVDSYDKSLDKIAVRGDQVRMATVALGADPDAADPEGDAALDEQMKEMTGGETTTLERDALLQEKFGGVAGVMRAKVDADRDKRQSEEGGQAAPEEADAQSKQ